MKCVIDGKSYSTETATHICDLPCAARSDSDFEFHDTSLYRSPKGQYFIAGHGGPRSLWAVHDGDTTSGESGIRLVDDETAREYAEWAKLSPEEMEKAGFEIEEG